MIADPPLLAGAVKVTVSDWLAATMPPAPVVMVGGPGVVYGVPDWEAEAVPAPTALTARSSMGRRSRWSRAVVPSVGQGGDLAGDRRPSPLWHGVPKVDSEYQSVRRRWTSRSR